VLHPGGAGQGGSINKIKKSFQSAVNKINDWINQDPNWLPEDPGINRDLTIPFNYSRAPIPFFDLPFGINWRIGRGSTSSNRKNHQRSIQLFSAGGKYRNTGVSLVYDGLAYGSNEGYSELPGDVAYEPPVNKHREYDKGPGITFAKLFLGGKSGLEWPDFNALGSKAHDSFGFGAIYRGRPEKATILILADQQSQDDLFICRALTGNSGQRMQAFLESIGINFKYCIIRVLPVDTLDLSTNKRKSITSNAQVVKIYNAIFDKILSKNKTKLILTFGSVAGSLIDQLSTNTTEIIKLKAWRQSGAKNNWKGALTNIQNKIYPKDIVNPTFNYNGERLQIPRYDLPFGTLKWQGSSGDRAQRAKFNNGKWSSDYYKFFIPDWAYNLNPPQLTNKEQQAITQHP